MRRIRKAVGPLAVAAVALATALGVAPAAGAHGVSSPTVRHTGFSNCGAGYFCIYSGWDGGGARCQYRSNTANTADSCTFIRRGNHVLSVWNGHGKKATYFTQTNYQARVGSTKSGHGGNLMGTYQIRSIKF